MPWREVSVMDERREFVRLALQEGANRRELCRRYPRHAWPEDPPLRTGLATDAKLREVYL